MSDGTLAEEYIARHGARLRPIAAALEQYLKDIVRNEPRIDRVTARAKSPESFLAKAAKTDGTKLKYTAPMEEIQDQVAARVVTFYISDVERIQRIIHNYFGPIEEKRVEPESSSEFAYEGFHYVLLLPDEAFPRPLTRKDGPRLFELQIKTLFQHAWSEGGHDLIYKSPRPLTRDQQRRAAFTAAQAWGADYIFEELSKQLLVKA